MKIKVENPEEVAKEAFYLAWQVCGGPVGMGILQDRSGITKEDVIHNAATNGDYPGDYRHLGRGEISGDYVFGRMMKLSLSFTDESIIFPDHDPSPDYQSWCRRYSSYKELIEAAMANCK